MAGNLYDTRLITGVSDFEEIREEGIAYVDKTEIIYRLVRHGKYYFLSRPRRFGKSLLIDTLAHLFSGSKDLFEGLYIHDKWDWETTYPIIRFDFSRRKICTSELLERTLSLMIADNAKALGVELPDFLDATEAFFYLIKGAYEKMGQPAVILVDEYDKPLLDSLHMEVARDLRSQLQDFYGSIKALQRYLRFVMFTGVTQFSKVNIFSDLNKLKDISLREEYQTLCGFTEEEVLDVFSEEIAKYDMNKVREWYNGYSWGDGTVTVYNPYDIMLFLDSGVYKAYWFTTSTPTFLYQEIQRRQYFAPDMSKLIASDRKLSTMDIDNINMTALLFQSGYLTIKSAEEIGGTVQFNLEFPNKEVTQSFYQGLLEKWWPDEAEDPYLRVYKYIKNNDLKALGEELETFFCSVPHQWTKDGIATYEGYYATAFYALFRAVDLDVTTEDSMANGQLDMTVTYLNRYYIFEFKMIRKPSGVGSAMKQLKDRDYAAKYRRSGREIYLIGIEFDGKKRTVDDYKVEKVD